MLKKVLTYILNILLLLLIIILQLNVFNNTELFGTKFNLVACFVIVTIMVNSFKRHVYLSMVAGVLTDIVLGHTLAKYFVIFTLLSIILESMKNVYKQDTPFSVAVYTTIGMGIFEVLTLLINIFSVGITVGIITVIFAIVKSILLNILSAYVLFFILAKINRGME
ncbi:MAG: rod shape-determining protein MreD [Clostridia bacterium]|nr:rod shape-determining protein MreD [Clostridia bacterium]